MNIDLGRGYRLGTDKYQWILQKQIKRKDRETGEMVDDWKNISFHANPTQAVNFHADRLLRASDAQTLTEALEEVKRITAELTDALTVNFNVEVKK